MVRINGSPRFHTSPYHDAVMAAGVTEASVYNRTLLPTSFGDQAEEYRRLTEGVAMWDVACERQVQVVGPDAAACAQYLTARDLSKMKVGQGKYVAMCDHDGTLLNDPVLMKLSDDRYWFSIADNTMLLWCKAIAVEKGFDVTVSDPDVAPLAVQGPLAADLIAEVFGEWTRDLKYFWFQETELDDIPVVVCRSGWSKQGGYELFLQDRDKGTELWDRIAAAGERYGIGPGGPNPMERIESGLLSFGGDTTPESNPFEAGLERYVSLECEADYIGKAALAEIAAAGPARRFVGLMVDDSSCGPWPMPRRIDVRVGDRRVGTMSAVVRSPRLDRTIGVAQIASDVVERGDPVAVDTPWGPQACTIHSLPFI